MKARYDPLYGALVDSDRWFPSPAHLLRRAALLEAFVGYPPGRLLDAECGAGRLLIDWARLGHTGWGVDPDARAREFASNCVREFGVSFQIGAQPPDGERFDYLSMIEVLEHLTEPVEELQRWLTCLKPGGIIIASVPAFRRLWSKSDEWAGHVQRFEPHEFERLLETAGLTVLSTHLYGFPLASLTRHASSIAARIKIRRRERATDQQTATLASGHDRSAELSVRRILQTRAFATVLDLGIRLQRRSRTDAESVSLPSPVNRRNRRPVDEQSAFGRLCDRPARRPRIRA